MRIAVTGKIKANVEKLKKRIEECGFDVVSSDPDIVISSGGDGSLLHSERIYPGIPKIGIRDKSICLRCHKDNLNTILSRLESGRYKVLSYPKLSGIVTKGGKKVKELTAANDIVVRNVEAFHALRFELFVDGKKLPGTRYGSFVADGIVVATPFGSSGYFESVSRTRFSKGIGLAFNNPTVAKRPIIRLQAKFRLKVTRNIAHVCADNDKHCIRIGEGDSVTIRRKDGYMKLIKLR